MGGDSKMFFSASRRLRVLWLWLPVILWCSAIFYLSNVPDLHITRDWWDYPLRKVAHMVEFAILALLLVRALSGSTSWPRKRVFWAAFFFSVLYAWSDEFHQSFVPGRVMSMKDVLIDTIGAAITLRWVFWRNPSR